MKLVFILGIISMIHQGNSGLIFDFSKDKNTANWYIVNDGVMGGLSKGTFTINDAGHAMFKGFVTTENNGGFSSVRYSFNKKNVSVYTHVVLKVKGDGKSYQFRIKENQSQRYSYIASFDTSVDWEIIKIPLQTFYPGFRGYALDKPNYSGESMEQIAILIGNKTKESFALEIDSIYLE